MTDDPAFSLEGRVAIVTGGGTGIGAATARLFAAHGAAAIVLAARTESEIERVAAEITATSATPALPVPTDVKDEDAVARMVERTMTEFGRIDILVNNGGTRMGPLENTPTRAWDSVFGLNVRGPFLCTREAGRHMIASGRGGAIVNVSSAAGLTGVRGGAGYSAAKAGLQMFTRVTAAEWGRHGIRANCVAVGLVGSERAMAAWDVAGIDATAVAHGIPLGRMGQPVDVAYPILFLASDAASWVSGQTFAVDGGPAMNGPEAE